MAFLKSFSQVCKPVLNIPSGPVSHRGELGGHPGRLGIGLRWRLLTNVAKTMATVSPTGMPIQNNPTSLLLIKHCRQNPFAGGGWLDDDGAGAMVTVREADVAVPTASVTVSVVV